MPPESPEAEFDIVDKNRATARRLHAAVMWLPCLEGVTAVALPAIVVGLVSGWINVLFFVVLLVLLPTFAYYVLTYWTFRYWMADGELVVQSGLVFRRERRIPLDRVQEVEFHQSLWHRMLELVKVDVTTAEPS